MSVVRTLVDEVSSRRGYRQAVFLLVVGCLLAVRPAFAIGATEAVSPPNNEFSSTLEPHEFEVQAYEREFQVSREVAESRLSIQEHGIGIVRELEAVQGKLFAGVWFDNRQGEFVIPLLAAADRQSVEASLDNAHLEGDFRIESARFSMNELEAAQEAVNHELSQLISTQLIQTYIDPRTNSVVVAVAEEANASANSQISDSAARQDVNVEIEGKPAARFSAQTAACTGTPYYMCDKPLRSGVNIEPAGVATEHYVHGGIQGVR